MDEFRIKYYIDCGDGQNAELSSLDEKDMNQWKRDIEARALSEYHNKKIKVSGKKN